MNCQDTRNAIYSQGSVVGQSRLDLQVGEQIDLFGAEAAPANPFRWQGLAVGWKMKDIYGLSFCA